MKDKKKKKGSTLWFSIITGMISGVGAFLLAMFVDVANNYEEDTFIPLFLMAIGSAMVSFIIHIVVHELGHLVFGLLTGYKFSSFRIGSLMLIKTEDKLKFCKYSLAGTGGQCLLMPPKNHKKKPYILYNLGGIFFNLIFSAIIVAIIPLCSHIIAKAVLAGVAFGGVVTATCNAVPSASVDNDGSNTVAIGKDPYAIDAFYNQMEINYYISLGKSLKDIPLDLFYLPENANLNNKIISAIAVQRCNFYMFDMEIEKTYTEMKRLLSSEATLATIYYSLLKVECAYCEMVTENRKNVVDEFLDKETNKIIKAMHTNPSIVRFNYAYELFYNNNIQEADKYLDKFEKVAKNFPYPSLLDNERDLMNYAKEKYSTATANLSN